MTCRGFPLHAFAVIPAEAGTQFAVAFASASALASASAFAVIPAEAGIQFDFALVLAGFRRNKGNSKMDPGFRRDDEHEQLDPGFRRDDERQLRKPAGKEAA